MPSPLIRTNRLILTFPFIHEGMDVEHYVRWLNDSIVMQYSEQRHAPHTTSTQHEYLGTFPYSKDRYFWEIQLNTKPIGSVTAYLDAHNKVANLGIMIGERKYWGNGYASESWDAVSNFLYESGTRKLEAGCMGCNRPMISILEKTGYQLEGKIPGHFLFHGQPQDKYLYGKFRQAKVIPLKKTEAISSNGS